MSKIDLDDAAALFGREAGKQLRAAALKGLLSAAKRMATLIIVRYLPGARPRQPVDRGTYKAAWDSGKTSDGAYYENLAPHAPMVEYGVRAGAARPGRAMIEAIAEWAVRKGLADESTAKQAAFAIAHGIRARGIAPRAVMESANADVLDAVVREELERAMGRAAGKL